MYECGLKRFRQVTRGLEQTIWEMKPKKKKKTLIWVHNFGRKNGSNDTLQQI